MSYRNAARRRQTKGVVLFTVVCILLFLFIMIMSTLSVVSSAQTRTYTKFKENQAYFTARSGLESVTTSLWNRTYNGSGDRTDPTSYDEENNKLYKAFLRMMYPVDYDTDNPKRDNEFIVTDTDLSFEEMDNESDIAKIKVKFPQPEDSVYNDADLKYVYGECTVYIQKTGLKTARFVSHATLGDTESTIVLYVGPEDEPPDIFENALTTFGGAGSDNMKVFGGSSLNLNQEPDDPSLNTILYTNAGTSIQGNQYFNCNMNLDNAKLYLGDSGTVVAGDLYIGNNGVLIASGAESKVYVGGKLSSNVGPDIGSSTEKVDLYCDAFEMGNDGFELYGDLYIYGNDTVKLNGTINGNVYHLGTGAVTVGNKATITGHLYTNTSSDISTANGLTIGGTGYGTNATISVGDLQTPPTGTTTKTEVLDELPTLDGVRSTYAPYDGSAGTFSGWGYKKIGPGDEKNSTNYEAYDPANLSDYINNDGWVEWPGYSSLPYDASTGYYYIDAVSNSVNYHVSNAYSWFLPNDGKIMIKGSKTVNFYFDEGSYYIGQRAEITNDSIYNKGSISLTTAGANNINLDTNMYFWGSSTLQTEGIINAYIVAPSGSLSVPTANVTLPGVNPSGGINYDGISIDNDRVLGMGSLVLNSISASNAPNYFFVRKPSKAPDPKEPSKFWKDLYYFNR